MKRQTMKFMSFFFVLLVGFGVAACTKKSSGETPSSIGKAGGGTREPQPVPEGDWKQPYPNLVNITTVKSAGNDIVYEPGDDETNNPWIRAWKNDLGIEVTYDWIDQGGTQYDTKLNMAIASKTLPDVFRCNYIQFRQLVQAGLLMDITELYQKYTSQRIRDYEKTDPDTIKTVTVNGKLYGVPGYYYGVIDNPRDLWVRKDWYEAAGSPQLKTVADFENLARQFMQEHGGYGMGISNSLSELFITGPMFNVYLGNPSSNSDFWYKDSTGRIKAGVSHPEMKTALTYWAKWYQEGIINPDFANTDAAKMNEDIVNGKTGFLPWYQYQGWMNGPNLVATQGSDNAYMIPLPFPTVDGSQVMGQVGFPNTDVLVVNKDCPNPAAALKLMSHVDYIMFDPNTVLTEEEFRGFTDGQREHTPGAFGIIDPLADMLQFEHVLYAIKTGDTSQLFTAGMKKKYTDSMNWITKRDTGGLGAYLQQGFDGCAYDNAKFLLDNNFIVRTDMWGPPPEDFDKTVNAFDVVVQGFTRIIMGIEPVSSYDKIITDWYANGGQIMEDAVNRDYNK
ncbi:MAG: extracellular solute-binding protein [Treponema sp.]|jgi:putative aldouronate transport system substrate-binding protein|nr:extracellular solute-binding protein [Treponema sp.]